MKIPSMPFKILAVAPFSTKTEDIFVKTLIDVDRNNLDQIMAELSPSLYISLPIELCPKGGIDISIKRMKDFHPDQIMENNPYLKNLRDAKQFIETSKKQGKSIREIGSRIKEWPDLPPIHIEVETPEKKSPADNASIDNILSMVALPDEPAGSDSAKTGMSAQIETILGQILQHILSNETYIQLESVWRGLKVLLREAGTGGEISVAIANVTSDTLNETLVDLTTKLIEDLPSVVLVDLPFNNTAVSLSHLEKIADFSETLMVPSVCWVTHEFFHINTWEDFSKLPFLPNHLTGSPYAKWQKLEQSSSGRWLSVTCNRFLSRYPYGPENKIRTVPFTEKGKSWIAPVWAVAALMAGSILKTGWPTPFTAYPEIVLSDMPLNTQKPSNPIPAEFFFSADRVDQSLRSGLMPLCCIEKKDLVFMPKEIMAAGNSLKFQILLSILTKFIFWCLDNLDKNMSPAQIEKNFTQALTLFWEERGSRVPTDLEISAGKKNDEGKIPLRISLTPPHNVLPSGEKIELEFIW